MWNLLSSAGRKVIVAGVPQTYPVSPVNGCLISSFLTPSTLSQYTYPAELKDEIGRLLDALEASGVLSAEAPPSSPSA